MVSQSPYSPVLSPSNYFLVPRFRRHFKGRYSGTTDNINKAEIDQLNEIPVSKFQHYYGELEQGLRRCEAFQGKFFEEGKVDL